MSRVAFVYHPDYLRHETGDHPERPARVAAIAAAVERAAMPGVERVAPAPATLEQVARVHPPSHVAAIRRSAAGGGGWLTPDTVVSPASCDVALLAAGGAIRAVEAVLSGEHRTAFAAVRPPGHHAGPSTAAGFCLLNNVAIAVRHAQATRGVARVLVVDFDVHHGNGTQEVFAADPCVLYVSTHQWPLYPGTGAAREVGRGAGRGATVNVPLPAGAGDAEFRRVFDEVLAPLARRFRPELILASAGYDAHWRDPLGGLAVSTAGFAWLVGQLVAWAEEFGRGRLALVLEGGYDQEALATSALASLAVLAGLPAADSLGPAPRRPPVDVGPAIAAARRAHPEWPG